MERERLQKVIAQAGVASRRKAEELIEAGRVTVNGKKVTQLGMKVAPQKDKVAVDGVLLTKEAPVYYVMYKPAGVLSTVSDDKGRQTVVNYIETEARIYPVGRLDYDTTGLLLLTNDGEMASRLMHPRYGVEKEYVAKVEGIPERQLLKQLEAGVKLEDGKTAPARVKLLSLDKRKQTAVIRLIIHEGKNRQVRRMFEAIGHPVIKLKRERYGFLTLAGLQSGQARQLKPFEVRQLKKLTVIKPS
ncbi:pseudouridine synthase [Shouchella lonarensis]|uniref:Pseudouridine synthase n=1 Tax=Shouchella lonarensis TaxID=1464122 RepID=A0A1G6LDP5_9BACI|nr:pseudouridine synthase [Shouchella lonarensis]SDC41360.1 ribosomal large subunit pseudouridine synthase B [Shouchella lonarensis]